MRVAKKYVEKRVKKESANIEELYTEKKPKHTAEIREEMRQYWEGRVERMKSMMKEASKRELLLEKPREGLFIVDQGTCRIVNPRDGYEAGTLFRGDFFGEASLLQVQSVNYFGNIITGDKEVRLLFISKEKLERIPLYEIEKMRKFCENKNAGLNYMMAKRYGIAETELLKY